MVIFVVLSFVSKKVSDRLQMLIGTVINLLTLIYLIVYLPRVTKNNIGYVEFLVPCFFNVFSLPLIVLSSISLLSKVTSLESQGMTQGIRRSLVGIGNNYFLCFQICIKYFELIQILFNSNYLKKNSSKYLR